ncbi:MAG: DUF971 domain-containing protein [Anaerolineales bacterium]|nr:DUF971 domain-containing protein [Anaerolineales bacterium]
MNFKPTNITVLKSQGMLVIDWIDGHRSEYPLTALRAACPCAECRGGHANMSQLGSPEMLEIPLHSSQKGVLVDLKVVGNYALQVSWEDGHAYGIYSWDYLRSLCPCGNHED